MLSSLSGIFGRRIKYKIIFPYMALAAIMLLLLTALTFYTVANRLERQLELDLRKSATSTGLELEYLEQELLDQLRIVITAPANPGRDLPATSAAFANQNQAQIKLLLRAATDFYAIPRVLAFNSSGVVVADMAYGETQAAAPSLEGDRSLAANPLIKAVLAGQSDELGDKYADVLLLGDDPASALFFVVAPVRQTQAGGQTRVVGAVLFGHPLTQLVRQRLPQRNGFALTAILDSQGEVLASNAPGNNADLTFDPQVLASTSTFVDSRSLGGQSYQVLFSPLRIRRTLDGFVAVAQSRDVVISTWADSRTLVFVIGAIMLMAVLLLGNWITGRITTPISDLAASATAVRQGRYDHRTSLSRRDEVGTLAEVFNSMTDRLLDLYRTSQALGAQLSFAGIRQEFVLALNQVLPSRTVLLFVLINDEWMRVAEDGLVGSDLPFYTGLLHDLGPIIELDEDTRDLPGASLATDQSLILSMAIQQQMIGMALVTPQEYPESLAPLHEHLSAIISMTATALYNAVLYANVQTEAAKQRAIVQSIADGVLVLDSSGRIVLANHAASEILHLPDDQLIKRDFGDLPLAHVTEHAELFAPEGEAQGTLYSAYERILRLSQSSISSAAGRLSGDVIVLHDMTAEHAVNRAKTNFIATISHELRTPLTTLVGYTDLLQQGIGGSLSATQAEFLNIMGQQIRGMNDMLQNTILIARIDAGTLTPEIDSYEVAPLLGELIGQVRGPIETKGIELKIDIGPNVSTMMIDREYLRIILTQLLNNARQHTHRGAITVAVRRVRSGFQMAVRDTGDGIAAEDLPHLFTRFQRGGEQAGLTSVERGSGLGLVIVRQLVEQLGGTVNVTSVPGEGTTVAWTLPYVQA
jgi:signal transduction histidine kinase